MFLADQGRDAIIIREIATFSHLPLIGPPSSIGQVYLGPFFYYLVAPFLPLFFFNPAGLAYGVSFLFIAGLIAAYFVIARLENKPAALLFLVLATFSYQLIMFARFSWNPNLLPVFAFFTLFFLYLSLKTKKFLWSLLYGAFFALSFQLHHLASFLAVPILLGYAYQFFREKHKLRFLLTPVVALGAFLAVSSPLILFDLKHDFLNTKNLYSLFAHQNVVAGGSPLARLLETNHAFWEIVAHVPLPSWAPVLGSLLILGGVLFALSRKRGDLFLFLNAANFFSFIYLFSLLHSPRHPHYYGPAYLSFFLVFAVLVAPLLRKRLALAFAVAVLMVYIGINGKDYFFIAGAPNSQIDQARTVAASIAAHASGRDFNIATYPVEFTSEDTYVYFLETMGYRAANREAHEVTAQMFVLCNEGPCDVLHTQSWNINMFGKAKIDTMWESQGIKIFKLVHEQ